MIDGRVVRDRPRLSHLKATASARLFMTPMAVSILLRGGAIPITRSPLSSDT
jgi:hypothetical protein